MKALILYPMNALANDQAERLTELLTTRQNWPGLPRVSIQARTAGPGRG